MFNKGLKYSYADQKTQAARIRTIVLWVMLYFVIYIGFTNFIFSMKTLDNTSMQPALNPGDRIIFYSFGIQNMLSDLPPFSKLPLDRGDIVLINRDAGEQNNFFVLVADKLCRFFTIGKLGFPGLDNRLFVKRIIGLPGDTVSLTNYVLRVKPADDPYTFTEFELSESPYFPNIPPGLALWDSSLPFSGNMDAIVLGEDQCFVLSDDRSNTNDSRTWGSIQYDNVIGKALFRYWPLTRLGLP